ncbi:MAG: hypothetical protein WEE89_00740 [Gemmatimonadota bacterium]
MENGNSKVEEFRRRMNELERAKRDADKLRQEAIAELLHKRKELNRELRQLGYEGDAGDHSRDDGSPTPLPASLFDTSGANGPKRKRMKSTREASDRTCPICEVAGHDLRAHRGQAVKRPFTAQERAARGL